MAVQKTLCKNTSFYGLLWHDGKWNEPFQFFPEISSWLKESVERVRKANPELYDFVTKGPKPLIDISLKSDKERFAQCFVQGTEKGVEIFFEPYKLEELLKGLNQEDKVSFLTYWVAHEMEHARQGQRGNVLYVMKENTKKQPSVEQDIVLEADATAVGIVTAQKAGLTLDARKALEKWFQTPIRNNQTGIVYGILIPNLGDILDSGESFEEMEEHLFKEDLRNRISIKKNQGHKVDSFSQNLQKVVQHPDALAEYSKIHPSINRSQNLSKTY